VILAIQFGFVFGICPFCKSVWATRYHDNFWFHLLSSGGLHAGII